MNKKILIITITVVFILIFIAIALLINRVNRDKEKTYNSTIGYVPNDIKVENKVENVIVNKRLNQKPENVKIEVDKSTITPESVTIIITDNNEDHYMYWEDFGLQKKVNGKWEYVDYIIEGFSWIDGYYGSYDLDENNQLIQKLDIEKYHGKLSKGTYRIVKIVTDANYMANINIYSDEFEIK